MSNYCVAQCTRIRVFFQRGDIFLGLQNNHNNNTSTSSLFELFCPSTRKTLNWKKYDLHPLQSMRSASSMAGFLKTLSSNGPFPSNSFFRPKTISKVAIKKLKSATIAFFSSPPFLLLALSFSPFLRCAISGLRNLPFDSNDCKFR